MITPFEIENKDFSKAMRGYNIEEVDEFLDEIILDLQKLLAENEKLKADAKKLASEMNQQKQSENSVVSTLESAKRLMNDLSASAEKRAEIIIKNAQLDAEVIQRDAKESISRLVEEGERLKHKVARFKDRYKQILENELLQIEGSSEDLLADLEQDFLPASMDNTSVPKQTVVQKEKPAPARTEADQSWEEMLKEDFQSNPKNDMTKTRII
ncbi:cell division initiation protein [Clostridiales Family XIII bacterium PM5-7]